MKLTPDKTCGVTREPDFFEGELFTPDSFFESNKKYLDNPSGFFSDYNHLEHMNLRDGFHPNAEDHHDTEKYGYRAMIYDSPIKSEYESNNIIPFRWFKNDKPAKTLILFSPGWARQNLKIEKRFCKRLLKSGIDSAILTKPYHQERAPKGSYSGEYFYSGNVFWTGENFKQYVSEIRIIIQKMRQYYDQIGIIGMSSGGFQSAVACCIEEVDFFFPLITGAQLGSIAWNGKMSRFMKKDFIEKGISEEDVNKVWSLGDQVFLANQHKIRHIKQYISLYDRIIKTDYQMKLWKLYGEPEVKYLHCAHTSVFFSMNKIADDIIQFIDQKNSVR
jgi:hypothetical protein